MAQTNPFFIKNDLVTRRTCRAFRAQHISRHLDALRAGPLGASLHEFSKTRKIIFRENDELEDVEGRYIYHPRKAKAGVVEYGDSVNAMILGHEIRHGWQHLALPVKILHPTAPAEKVLCSTFLEADARAIEFGVALQTIHTLRDNNEYSHSLIISLDQYQKEICAYSMDKVNEICNSPVKLKQALRDAFDGWIAISPAMEPYEARKYSELKKSSVGRIRRCFNDFMQGGRHVVPCFSRTTMNPDYPRAVAQALGDMGAGAGNYLSESKGPDFNDDFYTRPCNYQIETQIETIRAAMPVPRAV